MTIELSKILQPYEVLKRSGIIPGGYYNITIIMKALEKAYGDSVMPLCNFDDRNKNLYLEELRFCLDLNYNLKPCNSSELYGKVRYCKKTSIYYPPYPKF